jgi:ParB family chromosome partitioning protein
MTTAAAGNVADKDKEKLEKRRALGRGLASLLPGPRVVPPPAAPQNVGGGGTQQVPHGANAVRNDNVSGQAPVVRNDNDSGVAPALSTDNASGVASAAGAHPTVATGIEIRAVVDEAAELRSAGQPGAAVPTHAVPASWVEGTNNTTGPIELMAMAEPGRTPTNLVVNLAITDIDKNPFQTRYVNDNDALEELAESIKANGVVQPIVVRPSDEDDTRYVLVLGERRLHASKKAGKTHIPALVRKVSLQQAAEMTIIENLQREDLSPLEQAEAFRVLSNEFKLTQQQIGERVGLSRVSVANYMRLLKLPRDVMQLLAEKRINFAQAKELLKLEDNDRIAEAALYAVKKGMNIEQVEMLVLRMEGMLDPLPDMPGQAKKEKTGGGARWVDPNVRAAQTDLERMLGVRVRIRDRKGKGKIVIEYSTVDDYERVVEMLRGRSS